MELSLNNATVTTPLDQMKLSHSDNYTLRTQYHTSEIEQNQKIVTTAIRIIWVGFIVIVAGIFFAIMGKSDIALLTCISGVITEFISGCVFWLVGKTTKNKLNYYMQLTMDEERDKLMETISSSPNGKFREKMIEKLVDNHCNK